MDYPKARKSDQIDNYHGNKIADPYRWMEDANSSEAKSWVEEQNKLSTQFIANIKRRPKIKSIVESLWNFEKRSIPYNIRGKYFFKKNTGLQNQSILYYQENLESAPQVLLDPNTWSNDGTIALKDWEPSKDFQFLAYAISESGSDWQTIHVMNFRTKEKLADEIKWCKFTNIQWLEDNSGFFYGRYPEPESKLDNENNFNKIYFHKLGTSQSEDILIHQDPDKDLHFSFEITKDYKYFIQYSMKGTGATNTIHYRELNTKELIPIFPNPDAQYHFIANIENIFYFLTDIEAPNKKIISYNISTKEIKEIVQSKELPIHFARIVNKQVVVVLLKDAHHIVKIFDLNGTFVRELPLPILGTISSLHGRKNNPNLFFSLASS